jgi:hypothetical protein
LLGALLRTRRSPSPSPDPWPGPALASWYESPPQNGFPLHLQFPNLAQAFKLYKLAAQNSDPRVWCRCRYKGIHELELWFATERDRTRVLMLVRLHGLGAT